MNKRRRFSEKIDISKFIQKSSSNTEEPGVEIKNTFADFNFCEPISKNLRKRNFVIPTPIQDQAINHALLGRDIIGLADTGTGKTAVFLLPLIEKTYRDRSQNVLIIAPARELAQQIEAEFRQFAWDMRIFSGICVGGASMYKQIGDLKRNPNFVIGTPGRLLDLSRRGIIKFNLFQNVVIDEVDRMLDMGFIEDIKEILKQLPSKRQSFFFSATVPAKIRDLINQFSNNPVTIETKTGQTPKNVEQDIIRVQSGAMKFNQLRKLLSESEVSKVLIFIETKREVERITRDLIIGGFKADSIHGDKRQHQRQKALKMFRDNFINILVATDVAARGLDIKDITHVINYTVPQTFNDYIHRIGRTGRYNNKGFAYTFVENYEH